MHLSLSPIFSGRPSAVGQPPDSGHHLQPPENISGDFSGELQKCSPSPDLSNLLCHALPPPPSRHHHSTFVPITTAAPPSSSSSHPTAETANTRGACDLRSDPLKGAFGAVPKHQGCRFVCKAAGAAFDTLDQGAATASPIADSPGNVPESDPKEEPEADDDEDPEEDPADYPADRDDDDEEEEEPSGDDADDEDEDEEEEHLAPADSVLPVHQVEQLLALTTPPPSPLTPLSSPLPQIPSPLLPASPPASVLPALPLPTSSPPLQLLSSGRRADRPQITLPPQKRLGIDLGPRCEVGESSAAAAARPIRGRRAYYGFVDTVDAKISRRRAEEVGYGIRDAWVDPRDSAEEVALTTLEGVNTRVTELAAVQEQDTQDIYGVIEDTQGRQTQIYQRVETLVDDSQYHYETARLLDQEALVS
ncbi:hypothetical protein Tco_0243103 [Tanacetum coccineum]